jgi:hypothetical protein
LYNGIKSRVICNGQQSELFSCNVGIRQGENLSPFLFAIFLNALEEYLYIKDVKGLSNLCDKLENGLYIYLKFFVLLYTK